MINMVISDCSKCPYCDEPEETIEHAFLNCATVVKLWKDIEHWLRMYIGGTIKISNLEKIMGTGNIDSIVDKTIIATKRVIYENRQIGRNHIKSHKRGTVGTEITNAVGRISCWFGGK